MAKYTTTLEEYCQGRLFAVMLEDYIENDNLPEDPALVWAEACWALWNDPTIAYAIIGEEVMPDLNTYFYAPTDQDAIDDFIQEFTDKFYFNEIGQETMARFIITLRAFMSTKMPYYKELYNSRIANLAALASDYKRHMTDDLTKTGTEQDSLLHGLTRTTTPTNWATKNKIIPLGGSAEVELNESQQSGTESVADSGTDTTTKSFTNRKDGRVVDETITGATGLDKTELVKRYRELILDINDMIFNEMKAYGLFMEMW